MFAVKMFFTQQVLREDYPLRMDYSQIILCELSNKSGHLEQVVFYDECIFHSNAVVNKHNARSWSVVNSDAANEVPVAFEKVTKRCGLRHKW